MCKNFNLFIYTLDPNFRRKVPILDGGEGASEHILYGTNVDWEKEKNIDKISGTPLEAQNDNTQKVQEHESHSENKEPNPAHNK